MSASRPRANISAVTPLMMMPIAATTITVAPSVVAGIEQAADGLGADRSDGDQQEQGVDQRGEDRRFLQAVGEARRRGAPGHHRAGPGDDQPEHVRQIVAGVGQQRHRIGEEAEDRFGDHEPEVERDADREGAAEVCRRVRVAVIVVVMAVRRTLARTA